MTHFLLNLNPVLRPRARSHWCVNWRKKCLLGTWSLLTNRKLSRRDAATSSQELNTELESIEPGTSRSVERT